LDACPVDAGYLQRRPARTGRRSGCDPISSLEVGRDQAGIGCSADSRPDAARRRWDRSDIGNRIEEAPVQISFRRRNPLALLFATTKREHYLERYVLREHKRGRPFAEILEDAYIRNRSTPAERARLLDRPGVVAAIGEHALAELRLSHSSSS
jgi:hypothetical protein